MQAHAAAELTQHVPVIFFPEAERVNLSEPMDKEQYRKATKAMRGTMAAVYKRHSQLARLLLDAPVAATCEPPLPSMMSFRAKCDVCAAYRFYIMRTQSGCLS